MGEAVKIPRAPRILLVDDEDAILAALRKAIALSMPDANVHLALTREDALDEMRESSFDIVVSDLHLGKANGLDVLTKARAEQPGAVRILITAYPQDADSRRVVNDAQLDHILEKPFHMHEFVGLVERAFAIRAAIIEHLRAKEQPGKPAPRKHVADASAA